MFIEARDAAHSSAKRPQPPPTRAGEVQTGLRARAESEQDFARGVCVCNRCVYIYIYIYIIQMSKTHL